MDSDRRRSKFRNRDHIHDNEISVHPSPSHLRTDIRAPHATTPDGLTELPRQLSVRPRKHPDPRRLPRALSSSFPDVSPDIKESQKLGHGGDEEPGPGSAGFIHPLTRSRPKECGSQHRSSSKAEEPFD